MIDYFIIALLLASFGYTTGVLRYLGNRIDLMFGMFNRLQNNEIKHLIKAIEKLQETKQDKPAPN